MKHLQHSNWVSVRITSLAHCCLAGIMCYFGVAFTRLPLLYSLLGLQSVSSLKETPSQDASWSEVNHRKCWKRVNILHYMLASHGCTINIHATEVFFAFFFCFFCFRFEVLRVQPCCFALFQWRPQKLSKRLAHDAVITCATHQPWSWNQVKNTDCQCQTQNGSAHGHIFRTFIFKYQFLTT